MVLASLMRRLSANRRWGVYFSFNRTVYILLLFTLGKGFQLSIGQVTINLYVYSLTHDLQFVGICAAMSPLGALLAGVPMGLLADRVGRKPLLIWGGLLTPLSLILLALSTSPLLLITANLVNGFVASPYWVTNLPLLAENTNDEQRVGALAMNNFLLLGVGALGALIGGIVPEMASQVVHQPADATLPLRWGVLAAAFVVLLPALPLFWVRETPRHPVSETITSVPVGTGEHIAETIRPGAERAAWAASRGRWGLVALFAMLLIPDVLFTTGEGMVVSLEQLFFHLRFLLDLGALGVLITVAGVVGGATSLVAPGLVKRWGQLKMATTMQYLSAPMLVLIGFSPVFLLAAVAEFMRQILRGLFEPVYAAFAMESVSARHRATLSGFYSLTWSIGYSIGSVLEGFLQDHVSLSASFPVGALLLLISATLLRVFFGRAKPFVPQAK
ncbi:MAG TPA: MFS transporter [Ktedonobacterales bacterium]